jgi:regulator of protease activity HflC (stomatin/prohibitin superfamily)
MKKNIIHAVAALFLVLLAAPLFAVQRNAVDEVIRMSKAGVAEETMLDYLAKTDAKIVVTGDDIIAMTDANVPKDVIKAVVDAAGARRDYRDRSYSSPRVVVTSP